MTAVLSDEPFATEDIARRAVIDACLAMNACGINQGKAGNASVRWDRGGAQGFLVTPTALAYERTAVDDIVWVSIERAGAGDAPPRIIDGTRAPSSEWRIHRDVYAVCPAAGALVHAHSPFATSLACLPRVQLQGIPAFHYMVGVAGGADIACAPYATYGTRELSDNVLAALQGRRACLMANHGMLAYGASLVGALALAIEVETLARMYSQALQLGEPVILENEEMARVLEKFAARG